MENILETEELTKNYSGKNVINKINLTVPKGAVYGLIGKNGSGKTTTIRMISELASPTSGKIKFFEDSYRGKRRSKISAVIEYPSFYPFMSAFENMESQRILLGIKDKSVSNVLLNELGLGDAGNKKVKNFSLGMKQRLAIAVALLGEPDFLFLDEPINGLDPSGIKEMRQLILSLNQEKGVTIMISSHILGELTKIATYYGIIREGELIDQFSAEELKTRVKSCVKIKVNDVSRAINSIAENLGLNDYRLDGNEITVYDEGAESGIINSELAKSDVIVESISSEVGDYEDYFIRLMGGGF
ncbi:MAG: ATP-binding cassette domain-containing protein [Oscillospiraceae bacterium]|nr:ATP-binding cassette domain-containing protein [Oscillospiraceae bacterium]